ncbi:MAG: DUF4124 domain-containing protein [Giesbergeria sp.]
MPCSRTLAKFGLAALVCTSALLGALGAQAQVLRCTDAHTGKVTYTDSACDSGTRGLEVQPRQSPEELALERAQGEEAAQRMRERLADEAAAAQQRESQQVRDEREARRAQREAGAVDYANSAACANARRALDAVAANATRIGEDSPARLETAQRQMDFSCLGPEGYARTEAARASRPQVVVVQPPAWPMRPRHPHNPPQLDRPYIKECSSFTCIDSNGKRYPRTGKGSFDGR